MVVVVVLGGRQLQHVVGVDGLRQALRPVVQAPHRVVTRSHHPTVGEG